MTYDPNFPRPDPEPAELPGRNRGWTVLIGVLAVGGVIAFLASGKSHNGIAIELPPVPATNAAINSPATATPGATLPAARSPTETTGSAPRSQ